MKPEDCPKLNQCYKITMVLDKDLLDFQYAEVIRVVCARCAGEGGTTSGSQRSLRQQPLSG
jgi:hypothetical protein